MLSFLENILLNKLSSGKNASIKLKTVYMNCIEYFEPLSEFS